MGLEEERRDSMKEACVGWDSFGSLKWVRDWAKARFAVDERAREEYFWGVSSWRRVCWRRVRMHEVQTVEEDIVLCFQCRWYICYMSGGDVKESHLLLLANSQGASLGKFTSGECMISPMPYPTAANRSAERPTSLCTVNKGSPYLDRTSVHCPHLSKLSSSHDFKPCRIS